MSFKHLRNTMKIMSFDKENSIVITDKIELSLHAQLDMKFLGAKTTKRDTVKEYCESNDSCIW